MPREVKALHVKFDLVGMLTRMDMSIMFVVSRKKYTIKSKR
jgi:hypothetical protein